MTQAFKKCKNQLLVWPRHLKSAKISCWYDPRPKKVQKSAVGMTHAVNALQSWLIAAEKRRVMLAVATLSTPWLNFIFTYLGLEISPGGRYFYWHTHLPFIMSVLPIHMSTTCLSFCPHVHLFVRLPICPSICLPACLSICVSVYRSVCQPISLSTYLSVHITLCLYICLSIHLSISLSISLSVSLPTLSPTCLPFDLYVCLSI